MAEPSLERLSRFTPDAGRLDRDALLFAAGRASARSNRGWKTLAALLAGTQALTLVLLWSHPTPSTGGSTMPVASVPTALEPPASRASVNHGQWSPRYRLLELNAEDQPAGDFTLIESGPPLRAFPLPPALLN